MIPPNFPLLVLAGLASLHGIACFATTPDQLANNSIVPLFQNPVDWSNCQQFPLTLVSAWREYEASTESGRPTEDFIQLFQYCADQCPDVVYCWTGLGYVLYTTGGLVNLQKCFAAFAEGAKLDASEGTNLAWMLYYEARYEETLVALVNAESVLDGPSDSVVRLNWSVTNALSRCALKRECDDAMENLARVLSQYTGSDHNQAALGYIHLGKLYRNKKLYRQAWEAFERGNQLVANLATSNNQAIQVTANELLINSLSDGIVALHSTVKPVSTVHNRIHPKLGVEIVPVFILGFMRTGSTLLQQMLAQHQSIETVGELCKLGKILNLEVFCNEELTNCNNNFESRLSETTMEQVATTYLDAVADAIIDFKASRRTVSMHPYGSKLYVIDKTPENWRFVPILRKLFPNAYVIQTKRDANDVVLSNYVQHYKSKHYWIGNLQALKNSVLLYQRAMAKYKNTLLWDPPLAGEEPRLFWYEVQYEDLVRDVHGGIVADLLRRMGLPFQKECLEFYKSDTVVDTASHTQVRTPLNGGSVGDWTHFREFAPHIWPVQQAQHAQ